jgi:hypothetical protein
MDAHARPDPRNPQVEPRRFRIHLFSAAAQIVTTARRRHLRFATHWPWTDVITGALALLEALPNPGGPAWSRPYEQHHPAGAVEPGAHPTRQPGTRPAGHQAQNAKRSTEGVSI